MNLWDEWIRMGLMAQGVVITLLAMSMTSIAIMVERSWTYRQATRTSRRCAVDMARLLQQGKLEAALAAARAGALRRSHLAAVLAAALHEWQERDPAPDDREGALVAAGRAADDAVSGESAELRRRLSTLATIGSTAPFVGLFGTTFGIINAFAGIALTGSGGIGAVSAGISEALVTTAFGLFVAIPAVWAYNLLGARVEELRVEMERSRYQLLAYLERRA